MILGGSCRSFCVIVILVALLSGYTINIIWTNKDYRQFIFKFHQIAILKQNAKNTEANQSVSDYIRPELSKRGNGKESINTANGELVETSKSSHLKKLSDFPGKRLKQANGTSTKRSTRHHQKNQAKNSTLHRSNGDISKTFQEVLVDDVAIRTTAISDRSRMPYSSPHDSHEHGFIVVNQLMKQSAVGETLGNPVETKTTQRKMFHPDASTTSSSNSDSQTFTTSTKTPQKFHFTTGSFKDKNGNHDDFQSKLLVGNKTYPSKYSRSDVDEESYLKPTNATQHIWSLHNSNSSIQLDNNAGNNNRSGNAIMSTSTIYPMNDLNHNRQSETTTKYVTTTPVQQRSNTTNKTSDLRTGKTPMNITNLKWYKNKSDRSNAQANTTSDRVSKIHSRHTVQSTEKSDIRHRSNESASLRNTEKSVQSKRRKRRKVSHKKNDETAHQPQKRQNKNSIEPVHEHTESNKKSKVNTNRNGSRISRESSGKTEKKDENRSRNKSKVARHGAASKTNEKKNDKVNTNKNGSPTAKNNKNSVLKDRSSDEQNVHSAAKEEPENHNVAQDSFENETVSAEMSNHIQRELLSARLGKAIESFRSQEDLWKDKVPTKNILEIKNGYVRAQMMRERCLLFKQFSGDEGVLRQGKFVRHSFLSNKKLKLNICTNCKVASSTIRTVMYKMLTDKGADFEAKQNEARKFTDQFFLEQMTSMPNYPNVTFVREPLERLLSAYLDAKGYKDINSLSFLEFLQRILDEGYVLKNKHIQSYTIRCRTCDSRFSYIGLQHTFDRDMTTIMSKRHYDYSHYNVGQTHYQGAAAKLKQYFDQIPVDIIHRLWELYYVDYFIFGFPYPSHLLH